MKTKWSAAVTVLTLACSLQVSAWAGRNDWRAELILADKIKAAPPAERGDKAYQLELLVRRQARNKAPQELIDKLIDLMDEDAVVHAWVAAALGDLGPQASAAIPALKRVLEKDKAYHASINGPTSGIWPEGAIEIALRKIQAPKKP